MRVGRGATPRTPGWCWSKQSSAPRKRAAPPEARLSREILLKPRFAEEERAWQREDRIYFARRAAEEEELALDAADPEVAEAHRKMQRAYLERASVGDRPETQLPSQPIG